MLIVYGYLLVLCIYCLSSSLDFFYCFFCRDDDDSSVRNIFFNGRRVFRLFLGRFLFLDEIVNFKVCNMD